MDTTTYVGQAVTAADQPADTIWKAPLDITTWVVFAVAALLLVSLILFIKVAIFNRRPQKLALVFILLATPLYLIYYDDRFRAIFGDDFKVRNWARPLIDKLPSGGGKFNPNFTSDITPAIMVGIILLFHLIVLQRLASR